MDPYKATHVKLLLRQERRVNAARREIAQAVQGCIDEAGQGREVFDRLVYLRARPCIDRVYAAWYGMYPGDPRAKLMPLLAAVGRDAFSAGAQLAREKVRGNLATAAPDVLAALEDMAQAGRVD